MTDAVLKEESNLASVCHQGSELSGWALGRYSFEGIDMNHNFPDLNNIMWDAQELATDKRRVSNHYIPMPEYYTSTEALVRIPVKYAPF